MSVKINDISSATTFQSVTVPTAVAGDNSNVVANSAHTRSYLSSIGKIFNDGFSYTISAVKTLTSMTFEGHTLSTGLGTTVSQISVGTVSATEVNIATATTPAGNLYIGQQQQFLLPAGTAGYSIPAVCGSTQCKIQAGVVTATNAGTTVLFPVPYSSANPVILVSSVGATPKLVSIFFPTGTTTQNGFAVACQGGGEVNWVAIGQK